MCFYDQARPSEKDQANGANAHFFLLKSNPVCLRIGMSLTQPKGDQAMKRIRLKLEKYREIMKHLVEGTRQCDVVNLLGINQSVISLYNSGYAPQYLKEQLTKEELKDLKERQNKWLGIKK